MALFQALWLGALGVCYRYAEWRSKQRDTFMHSSWRADRRNAEVWEQ